MYLFTWQLLTISKQSKFPIAEKVMNNANCSVHYLLERHTTSLSLSDCDELFNQFAEYKILNDEDSPENVWVSAREKVYIDRSPPTDVFFHSNRCYLCISNLNEDTS